MVEINIPGDSSDDKSRSRAEPGQPVTEPSDGRKVDYRCADCGAPVYDDEPAIFKAEVGMVCRICNVKVSPERWWEHRKVGDPNHS